MNDASKLVINEMLQPIIDNFKNSNDADEKSLYQKAINSLNRVKSMITIGDTFHYLSKSVENHSYGKYESLLSKKKIISYEELLLILKEKYKSKINKISNMDDLKIGKVYTRTEVSSYSHNYNPQHGMMFSYRGDEFVSNIKREENGIVLFGDFADKAQYPNEWLDYEKRVKYHLKRKNNDLPDIEERINKVTINNSFPIYFFETLPGAGEKKYKYCGRFISTKKMEEDRFIILENNDLIYDEVIHDEENIVNEVREEGYAQSTTRKPVSGKGLRKRSNNKRKVQKYLTVSVHERDPDVIAYALRRANGKCEICNQKAPFKRKKDNSDYLEVHHMIPLSEGGDDSIDNVVAACPNCHMQAHYGKPVDMKEIIRKIKLYNDENQ